jgi:lipopolysaccharide transport system permease protein
VKRVVFPLEILPFVAMGSTLFHTAISLTVLLGFYFLLHAQIHWTVILVPLILLPLVIATLGLTWVLASLGVFIRDIGQATGILTMILLFLSPVFFPVSALPPR